MKGTKTACLEHIDKVRFHALVHQWEALPRISAVWELDAVHALSELSFRSNALFAPGIQVWTDMRPLSLQKFMAQHAPKTPGKKIEIPKAPEDGKDYFHGTITHFSTCHRCFKTTSFGDPDPMAPYSGATPQ